MLKLTDVKKAYIEPDGKRLPVLDIPSFSVDAGEQMVLVGPSGCGKTTLLHVIAGISRPDQGEVVVDGIDICRLHESGRDRFRAEKIGYVFQTFNLLAGFSALENVMLGMAFGRGGANSRHAKQLLDRVGLSHRMSHVPATLSVGEQQRVAVARSLANQPRLLLADEPTANVDPGNQQSIIDLIRQTCDESQVALVLVTHSTDVAKQFDRIDQLADKNQAANPMTIEAPV